MKPYASPLSSPKQDIEIPKHSFSGGVTHAGDLFKLGDGYMNRSWNSRYFILRGSTLQYYTNSRDPKPREVIDMLHATVSWLGEYSERSNCIHVDPIAHRSMQISGADFDEARLWFRWLQEAADPQGFADVANALNHSQPESLHASPVSSQYLPAPVPINFKIPASLPLHFVEAASLLESLVNGSDTWCLVDVENGVRIWSRKSEEPKYENLFSIIIIIGALFFNWIFALALITLYWRYPKKPVLLMGGSYVGEQCFDEKWIFDASRYHVWMPGSDRGFSIANDQVWSGGLVLKRWNHDSSMLVETNGSAMRAWCVVGNSQVWFLSNFGPEAKGVLHGLKAVTTALPLPALKTPRHIKGGLCIPEFGANKFLLQKSIKLGGTGKPLPALAPLLIANGEIDHFLTALLKAAAALGGVGWARFHPKVSDTFALEELALSVTECSRPSQGISVAIQIASGGVLRYELKLDTYSISNVIFRVSFAKSELRNGLVLPDFCFSSQGRVWWVGPAAVGSTQLEISPRGDLAGRGGQTNLSGHWLERAFLDNKLIWTAREEGEEQALVAPKLTDGSPRMRKQSSMGSFDEEAVEFIAQLKLEVPEMIDKFPQRFQTEYIYRFAKARQFKLPEVRTMILAHIAWLEEHRVDELLHFEYPEMPLVKAAFPHGYHGTDKFGRPIYISRLAKTNQEKMFQVTTWERFIKFWIQSYEALIWHKMPICKARGARNPVVPGQPAPSSLCVVQTLSILDIKGIGLSQLSAKVREFISVTSKLASDNYPEILGAMYIVNSPAVFPMIWNGIKTMIDPGTRAKIHVLSVKQTREQLLEVVDEDQLPFFLGGTCKCAEGASEDSDFGCLSSDKGPWQHNSTNNSGKTSPYL